MLWKIGVVNLKYNIPDAILGDIAFENLLSIIVLGLHSCWWKYAG